MSKNFTHLHLHSQYSLLDGAIRMKDLFKLLNKYEMKACGLTDHGNMFGAVEFFVKAKEAGVRPIIGCELYIADNHRERAGKNYHLVLLCENNIGYRNLSWLVSIANKEGYYYHPRIDLELLAKYSEGLIGSSACMKGMVPSLLLANEYDKAKALAHRMNDILGGRFYLEIQENGIDEQIGLNKQLLTLSGDTGIPLIATNDCHYLVKEDAGPHEVLLCIQTGKKMSDEDRMRYSSNEFYVKSAEEMAALFHYAPEALENTHVIAERCDVTFDFKTFHFPKFSEDSKESLDKVLEEKTLEGMRKRWPLIATANPEADKRLYYDRVKTELSCIWKMGFSGYFLIVSDFINWAKEQGIPVGPGRGSAAGSLVSYAIGITDLDPIPYNLLFERFLNPERISMPDIDVDFCQDRREEVIAYVKERYGEDKVCQIITFGTMNARGVIRDTARALDFPYSDADAMAKLIPEVLEITIEKALEMEPAIKERMDADPNINHLIKTAMRLEGLSRHASTHAAGVLIAPDVVENLAPVYKDQKSGGITTQYNMKYVEKIGLVKFDFLGLKNLTIIDNAVKLIRMEEPSFDVLALPMDDTKTYELLKNGDTTGVFQLESEGMKELLRKLKPTCFEDVIAVCALYRPGPLNSGMVDDFINRKHGKQRIEYVLPELEPVLKDTYGVIVYQEQVMKIAQVLAGYSLGEADLLRRAMGKKIKEEMDKQGALFCERAIGNGIAEPVARGIFDLMAKFAEYGFNKSHSAAYAYIAYQTAYLKAHHPVKYMSALITADMGDSDKIIKEIAACRDMDIEVLPPDINRSDRVSTIEGGNIRFGFGVVKNVGKAAIESIIAAREAGPFTDIYDVCCRVDTSKANKKVLESLNQAGAFDSIEKNRAIVAKNIEYILSKKKKPKETNQLDLFGGDDLQTNVRREDFSDEPDWDNRTKLRLEKEVIGFYCSGHPMGDYAAEAAKVKAVPIGTVKDEPKNGQWVVICGVPAGEKSIITKKGDKMAFLILEDLTGNIEVTVFPELYRSVGFCFNDETPVVVRGSVNIREQQEEGRPPKVSINANEISFLKIHGGAAAAAP